MTWYQQQLKDPKWACRRVEFIAKNDGICHECRREHEQDNPLQVHHISYVRGMNLWDYPDELMLVICKGCHLERQCQDEEARYEFSRLCGKLTLWEVHEVKKAIRNLVDDGEWKVSMFDAYQAICKAAQK